MLAKGFAAERWRSDLSKISEDVPPKIMLPEMCVFMEPHRVKPFSVDASVSVLECATAVPWLSWKEWESMAASI